MKNFLVFDWGGTYIKYALMNEQAEILESSRIPSPKKSDTIEQFWSEMDPVVHTYEKRIDGIAISSPGIINSEQGTIEIIGAFPFLRHVCIREEFTKRYHLPCAIENDAKCAALAELWRGNLQGVKDGAVWIIGTGIGGGIVLDGKLRRGKDFFAGEFSGTYTDIFHPERHDSYTAFLLGTNALCAQVQKAMGIDHKIDGEEAFSFINQGKGPALNALQQFTDLTARALFSINLMLNLEKICIGGGISEQPALFTSLEKSIARIPSYHPDMLEGTNLPLPVIAPCRFHSRSNLIGALYHLLYETSQSTELTTFPVNSHYRR